jgi:hypothetical protein
VTVSPWGKQILSEKLCFCQKKQHEHSLEFWLAHPCFLSLEELFSTVSSLFWSYGCAEISLVYDALDSITEDVNFTWILSKRPMQICHWSLLTFYDTILAQTSFISKQMDKIWQTIYLSTANSSAIILSDSHVQLTWTRCCTFTRFSSVYDLVGWPNQEPSQSS